MAGKQIMQSIIEIIRNKNGVYLLHTGSSVHEKIKCLSNKEKDTIKSKAEYDLNNQRIMFHKTLAKH